jgi:hypothetical protein
MRSTEARSATSLLRSPQIPHITGAQGYAVVSCHVERPLDDLVWARYETFVRSRPGGFAVASLMRPPMEGEEGAERFVERAGVAAQLGPLGHHTHWTSPTAARPTDGDPAARVRTEGAWLTANGLRPRFFCGGGWYMDLDVMSAVADLGYADCTALATRPAFLDRDAAHIELGAPAWLVLPDGRRVLELPSTHSAGAAARSLPRRLPRIVHVHFHDYELLDRRRALLFSWVLRFLARRRKPADLGDLHADGDVDWSSVCAA